jgi:mRNA interferase MazF
VRAVRTRVYWVDIGHGEKPYLCVSNNSRNNTLDTWIAARITTTIKPDLNTVVRLSSADRPLVGSVLCDDLVAIFHDEIRRDGGALSTNTMMGVGTGLKAALALL